MSNKIRIHDMTQTTQLGAALSARGWLASEIEDDRLTATSRGSAPVTFEVRRTADIVFLGRLIWPGSQSWPSLARIERDIRDANAGWFANHGGLMQPGLVELVSTTASEVEWAWSARVPVFWTVTLAMQAAGMTGARVAEG